MVDIGSQTRERPPYSAHGVSTPTPQARGTMHVPGRAIDSRPYVGKLVEHEFPSVVSI